MSSAVVPIIRKLDELVVNRIAAGEVVQKPAAAIKEMVENSLDAGATSIIITVKSGGLQFLQIQDNGHGIRKEDLGIVCERFTTSKLSTFEDLKKISTFGFRGEALASITHVAHVTITTKTSDSSCAFKAKYSDGKLVPLKPGGKADPQPCAGVPGTTITVEDLFYNMPTRKQAFKNANEQYQKILDVITKYAVHYGDKGISFICKKHGQNTPDIHTPPTSSTLENIKIAYGNTLARELMPFELNYGNNEKENDPNPNASKYVSDISNELLYGDSAARSSTSAVIGDKLIFQMSGYLSNANYSSKKSQFILFINNRLVECSAIKKVLESVYAEILPKHTHPFIYLSIAMPSQHIDVNVHPTKKEVHFMFEEELMQQLYTGIHNLLKSANQSRTFYTQSITTDNNILNSYDSFAGDGRKDTSSEAVSTPVQKDAASDANVEDDTAVSALPIIEPVFFGNKFINQDERSVDSLDEFKKLTRDDSSDEHEINDEDNDRQQPQRGAYSKKSDRKVGEKRSTGASHINANKLVRTDASQRGIDAFFQRATRNSSKNEDGGSNSDDDEVDDYGMESATVPPTRSRSAAPLAYNTDDSDDETSPISNNILESNQPEDTTVYCGNCNDSSNMLQPKRGLAEQCKCCSVDRKATNIYSSQIDAALLNNMPKPLLLTLKDTKCEYESIQSLLATIYGSKNHGIIKMLRSYSFIGIINSTYCLVQYETKLLLLNYSKLCNLLFQQLVIRRFGEMNYIPLDNGGVSIYEYLCCALSVPHLSKRYSSSEPYNVEQLAMEYTNFLVDKSEMLREYFSIIIDSQDSASGGVAGGLLSGIPDILEGYMPNPIHLPKFLLNLVETTNWTEEKECFQCISATLASFYADFSVHIQPSPSESSLADSDSMSSESANIIQYLLFPSLRLHFLPPNSCLGDGTITQLASLEQLYKIFERC